MSYLVVARKWRPQTFEDVAGQAPITRTLQNAIRTNRVAHAYLFAGVRGVGKTTAARILAKALNCASGPTPTPCNRCTHCEEITNGKCIDVLEIDGASNRGIDEVRQIIENVRYQPANCRFKIYIIDEVHQVTKEAFQALLKTLEEPPPSVKFILATTEPQRLPETILSRCQRYDFRRIALREIVERLGAIAKDEGLKITDGALVLLAREADGSMRDAQSFLEQVLASAGSEAPVDEALLQELLGISERRALYDLSAAVIAGDAARCVELLAALSAQGRDLGRLSRDLLEHFRNLLVARLTERNPRSDGAELLDLPDQEIADLKAQAKNLSVEILMDYFDVMAAGDEEVARAAVPRFALEAVLIRLAILPDALPARELLEHLEALENRFVALSAGPSGAGKSAIKPITTPPNEQPRPAGAGNKATIADSLGGQKPSADKDDVWRQFVSMVRKEEMFLAEHLASAKVLDLVPGRISLGVSTSLERSSLEDPSFRKFAKRFFSDDVLIEVKLMEQKKEKNDEVQPGSSTLSPLANETLRVFPGSSVRSVRRDGGEG